jgi:hypothetical protein
LLNIYIQTITNPTTTPYYSTSSLDHKFSQNPFSKIPSLIKLDPIVNKPNENKNLKNKQVVLCRNCGGETILLPDSFNRFYAWFILF